MDPRLVEVALKELPGVIGALRSAFAAKHPGVPAPTDEEVIAAYQSALASSLAKDEAWLTAHPA